MRKLKTEKHILTGFILVTSSLYNLGQVLGLGWNFKRFCGILQSS